MIGEKLFPTVLATRTIANVSEGLAKVLKLPKNHRSIGLITCDMDDPTYVALDAATKAAEVQVAYGKSMYAGAGNASTPLAGEVIGMISAESPEQVKSGMQAMLHFIDTEGYFESADKNNSIVFFAHTISRTGSYLSKTAGIKEGEALAYLIAPPLEAVYGLDAALKASDVTMVAFYEPPSETNFGGGLLTGSQSACLAACNAFREAVIEIANQHREV